jgi:hypothetical protein
LPQILLAFPFCIVAEAKIRISDFQKLKSDFAANVSLSII